MARSSAVIAFCLILLCLVASSAVYLGPVKAVSSVILYNQGNVTINANGSITPTSVPIILSGNTYNLTGNVNGAIIVKRSNIVLNGNGFGLSNGLLLYEVSNITATGFVIQGNELQEMSGFANVGYPEGGDAEDGVLLSDTSNVTIVNNTISDIWSIWELNGEGFNGIDVEGGNSNNITGNLILNDAIGMYFDDSQHNLIINNNIMDNSSQDGLTSCGIWFWDASNNTIYHNNIIDNLLYGTPASNGDLGGNPYTPNSANVWDDGFPAGGNYWGVQWNILENIGDITVTISEHIGKEIGNTGISDSPYVIDPQNIDHYPLIRPFNSSFLANYQQEIIPPRISVKSPLSETYSRTNISLVFSIDKPSNWIGYSLDGQNNVTVNGNTTIPDIGYGSHSITVYANSTFGIIGASKTIEFSVAKPFPTLIVTTVISVAVATIVSLLIYRRHRKTANLSK